MSRTLDTSRRIAQSSQRRNRPGRARYEQRRCVARNSLRAPRVTSHSVDVIRGLCGTTTEAHARWNPARTRTRERRWLRMCRPNCGPRAVHPTALRTLSSVPVLGYELGASIRFQPMRWLVGRALRNRLPAFNLREYRVGTLRGWRALGTYHLRGEARLYLPRPERKR